MASFWQRLGQRLFANNPAPRVPGIGTPALPEYPHNAEQQKLLESPEALRGAVSYGAGPSHTRFSTYPATGLTPATVYSILQLTDQGQPYRWSELCEQILERDGHLRGVDKARRVEVSGKPFRVRQANETPLAISLAKFIRAVIDQIDSFDRSIFSMLSANGQGYSLSEIIWAESKVRFPTPQGPMMIAGLFPRQLDWVHSKHVMFSRDTDKPQLNLIGGGYDLPAHKFIFHSVAGDSIIVRRGYMRSVVWLHLFKQQALRDWAVWLALFGIPNIRGQYPRELYEQSEAKAVYQQLLRDYGQGLPILAPDDISVTVDQPPAGGTASGPHAAMVGWCNTEMSKTVQGETLTTELGGMGSYNAASAHADVKHAIVVDDSRHLASTLRADLFRSIIELNIDVLSRTFGASPDDIRASVPFASWRIEREVSPSDRLSIFAKAVGLGLKIPEEQLFDEFGFDHPTEGAAVIKGEPTNVPDGAVSVGSVEASDGVDNPKDQKGQPATEGEPKLEPNPEATKPPEKLSKIKRKKK